MALVNKGWYRRPWDGELCWAVQDGEDVFGFRNDHFAELSALHPNGGLIESGYLPMRPRFAESYTYFPTREEAEAHVEKEAWE